MADSIPGNTTSTKTLEIGASDTSSIDFLCEFIARTLKKEIPYGWADHKFIERLPIVRVIKTIVDDLFFSKGGKAIF